MTKMCHVEYHAQSLLDTSHVVGGKLAHFVAHLIIIHIHLAYEVCQLASINLHRA